jgi:PiT family inorganic phosphate transporter
MSTEYIILIIGYVLGFYMAWNIGANDVANSMASAVGAKAITIRQALFIAGILNVIGAVFIGSHVTDTIRKGIISTEFMTDPRLILTGSLSALLAASLWISFSTWKALPISTTHSIVGSMIGFGLVAGGFSVVQWKSLAGVVASWIISPFFAIGISYCSFKLIIKVILNRKDPFLQTLKLSPFFIGIAMFVVILSFLYKTPLGTRLSLGVISALLTSTLFSIFFGFIGKWLIQNYVKNRDNGVEEIFRRIQIGTSCYVALSQGANDVANAIGPLAAIYFLAKTGNIGAKVQVPFFLLFFGGIGIACGISMAGYRVMETLGEKITTLTNTRGFAVDFAAATTVLAASKLGLPVSTTHAAVGGVIGVGLAGGIEAVNFGIVFKIVLYWILTVPIAAATSMIIFKVLQMIF